MANKLSKKVLTLERPALGSYEPLLAPKPAPDSFSHPNDPVKELALDTITEFTTNNGVTVDGVLLKDGNAFVTKLTTGGIVSTSEPTLIFAGFFPCAVQDNIAAGSAPNTPISVTNYLTTINTDAGGDTFTLADGSVNGQLKKILLVVDGGGNAVITPANLAGGTTITMNDAADYVVLMFNALSSPAEWVCIENSGSTIA
jgi:hypothetical protein